MTCRTVCVFFLQPVRVFNIMMFYTCNSNNKYWKQINFFLFNQRACDYCSFKSNFRGILNYSSLLSIILSL